MKGLHVGKILLLMKKSIRRKSRYVKQILEYEGCSRVSLIGAGEIIRNTGSGKIDTFDCPVTQNSDSATETIVITEIVSNSLSHGHDIYIGEDAL